MTYESQKTHALLALHGKLTAESPERKMHDSLDMQGRRLCRYNHGCLWCEKSRSV